MSEMTRSGYQAFPLKRRTKTATLSDVDLPAGTVLKLTDDGDITLTFEDGYSYTITSEKGMDFSIDVACKVTTSVDVLYT